MGARSAPAAVLVGLALALAACGGSTRARPKGPPAARVCEAAHRAAAQALGGSATVTITDHDPTYIQCTIGGRGVNVAIVAEADAQVYTDYDTITTHLAQAYGAAGKPQNPVNAPGLGTVASWYPTEGELVATTATPTRGGSLVTVSFTHWPPSASPAFAAARVIARRVFAVAPRGPNPGPPPS